VPDVAVAVPAGRWRDVLDGGEYRMDGAVALGDLVGEHGVALLERAD
jgi:maltooligosyltrehalose synthase